MGYVAAFLVYHIGTLMTSGTVGVGFVPGVIAVAAMIGYVLVLVQKGNAKAAAKLAGQKA